MHLSSKRMFEKYYVLLPASRKPNPPTPLPYEGMGILKPLSASGERFGERFWIYL